MSSSANGYGLTIGVLAALLSVLCGCTPIQVFGKEDSEARAEQLDAVQLKTMEFADQYVSQIVGPLNTLQAQTLDPRARLDAQNWKVSQSTAAYTNASQPNPVRGALDMVVLAALSRIVVEEESASPSGRLRSAQLREAHRKLEHRAWELSAAVLDEQQQASLRAAVVRWHDANPDVRAVSLVHFGDVSGNLVPSETEGFMSKGLLGLIGIEALRGLDPAVREIAETRQLAQRSVYYIQRAPGLLDMQIERLSYQLGVAPESRQLLENAEQIAHAAQQAGQLAQSLPTIVSQERDAAITQIAAHIDAQQEKTRALARELRDMLDAGTATSNSVDATVKSIDALVSRFKAPTAAIPAAGAGVPQEPKPAAVTNYIEVLRELSKSTEQLQGLIVTLDQRTDGVEQLTSTAASNAKSVVDYIVIRLILLASALALIVVISVLTCRAVSRRLR